MLTKSLGQTLAQIGLSSQSQPRKNKLSPSPSLSLLIMTQFFPPDFAATGQLIEELVRELDCLETDVSVFTGQPGYAFAADKAPAVEKTNNIWIKRSRMSSFFPTSLLGKAINGFLFAMRCVLYLARYASRHEVLMVTTAPPFLPVIGYLANLFFGIPYVCLLYDLYPDIAVELDVIKPNHPLVALWRYINRKVWLRAARIIVLSPSMKQHVIQRCPAADGKISVIHSWSNAEKIVPIPKEENWFAKEHSLIDHFVVLYSGNMGRCHDTDTLFEAALKLKDKPILFVCIGGGAKRSALKEAAEAANLNNFRFLPYQEKSVLPYSLTAGDLSLVSIASGMDDLIAPSKLYPAMAAGRPIAAICPRNSYLRPLLDLAQGGQAFDNGDADSLAQYIQYLSQNRSKADQIGEAGRRYMQAHFTAELIAYQYLETLKAASTKKHAYDTVSESLQVGIG